MAFADEQMVIYWGEWLLPFATQHTNDTSILG